MKQEVGTTGNLTVEIKEVSGKNGKGRGRRKVAAEELSKNSKANRDRAKRDYAAVSRLRSLMGKSGDLGVEYDAFLEQYKRLIWKIARDCSYLGDINDLYQAGYEGLLRAMAEFQPKGAAFSTIAYQYIRMAMHNHMTFEDYSLDVETNDGEQEMSLLDVTPNGENLLEQIMANQESDYLRMVVKSLHVKLRIVIVMRYFQGKTLEEVGQALSLTKEAIRLREEKALNQMKRRLQMEGYER